MSATDANRFVLRYARHLTGRPRIAVVDVSVTTAVVPFNDADALDRRLAQLHPCVGAGARPGGRRQAHRRRRTGGVGMSAEVADRLSGPML